MEKPSVTLRHDEAYLIAGFMFIITAVGVVLTFAVPAAQETRQLSLIIAAVLVVFCVALFFLGGCTETLDEHGIFIKRPFYSKQYPWSDVVKVTIDAVLSKGGKHPEFSLRIKKRRLPLTLSYTKGVMACITCYYGQPDQDKWGKPPMLL